MILTRFLENMDRFRLLLLSFVVLFCIYYNGVNGIGEGTVIGGISGQNDDVNGDTGGTIIDELNPINLPDNRMYLSSYTYL